MLKSDKSIFVKNKNGNIIEAITKKKLENEYIFAGKSAAQIERELNLAANTVRRWCKYFDIPVNTNYELIEQKYGKTVAENCIRVRSKIYVKSNKIRADKYITGKTREEILGNVKGIASRKKASETLKSKGSYEQRFGKERADEMKSKLRAQRLGVNNAMFAGFDQKMLQQLVKIANYFNFKTVADNSFKCSNGEEHLGKIQGHHIIRQGTILKYLEELYPEKYRDKHWVMDKFMRIHIELSSQFMISLCKKCHSSVKKNFKDKLVEKELIHQLNFENQLKKIVENSDSTLGKKVDYTGACTSEILYPISREEARNRIQINFKVNFIGLDIWNAYEFSFLNLQGKPENYVLQISYSSDSPFIVESKSLKLYLNSYNQVKTTLQAAILQISLDLKKLVQSNDVFIKVVDSQISSNYKNVFSCIDNIDITNFEYSYNPKLLQVQSVNESNLNCKVVTLYSHLLKSNCRHTKQPDWGSVFISYIPLNNTVVQDSLLRYLVSFREHNEFHEECCERILVDLLNILNPLWLKVECKYVRRGGLDINPVRIYDSQGVQQLDFKEEISKFYRVERQ